MSLTVNNVNMSGNTSSIEARESTTKNIDLKLNGKGFAVEEQQSDKGVRIHMLKEQAKKAGIPQSYIINMINGGYSPDSIRIDTKNHTLSVNGKNDTTIYKFKDGKLSQAIEEKKTKGVVTYREVNTHQNNGDVHVEQYTMKNGKLTKTYDHVVTKEELDDGV